MKFKVFFSDKTRICNGKEFKLNLKSKKIKGTGLLINLNYDKLKNPSKNFYFFEKGGLCFGFVIRKITDIEKDSEYCYSKILKEIKDKSLYRLWNFIPDINIIKNSVEIYKSFNSGRRLAFRDKYKNKYTHKFPAATGIDILGDKLIIIFIAGKKIPTNFENEKQIPSYKYPKKYGKRSPSFARATKIKNLFYFISGTASVRGHKSMHLNNIVSQFKLTNKNLRIMLKKSKMNEKENKFNSAVIYIRDKKDFKLISKLFKEVYPRLKTNYLLANICRNELDIEIEMSFYQKERRLIR
jgi:chorismate lyase/3-hydroxybenzoate synthase